MPKPFEFADKALRKLVDIVANRGDQREPTIGEVLRLAIDTLGSDQDEETAVVVLFSILLEDELAEKIYGRL